MNKKMINKQTERQESALAMILAGRNTTRRPLSKGGHGWGTYPDDIADGTGPVCAVGLGLLWMSAGAGADGFPIDYMAQKSGYSYDFWAGVSFGFEMEIEGRGANAIEQAHKDLENLRPWANQDQVDGLQVGIIAAELLSERIDDPES